MTRTRPAARFGDLRRPHSDPLELYETSDSEAGIPEVRERCPQCEAFDPVQTLLTSMTRYVACRRCRHRWPIAVVRRSHQLGGNGG